MQSSQTEEEEMCVFCSSLSVCCCWFPDQSVAMRSWTFSKRKEKEKQGWNADVA